jgi:cell fate regulator YaaT (PSP1 superfamily)
MLQAVKVRLRKPTRVFTFLARDLVLSRDDACIVRTDRGLEYGTCIVTPEDCSDEMTKRYTMSVIRKAHYNDENTFRQIVQDEQRSAALCARKIQERNLPMQLVDVEYTFDRHKIVFYFTADDRVDFRDLVRDLAHELKARIELRHIQVRDKAKIVGGFAACGRELCCATWLGEFMPISMKMAKRQNLSLNPAKISGQCGRLMCCLSYENNLYEHKKRTKPPAEPEEGEKVDETEWAALLEDEAMAAEEEAVEEEALEEPVAPGEAVMVMDSDGTEQKIEEDGEEESAGEENGGAERDQKPRRRSRRRRRRRRPSQDGGTAPAANP